MRKLLIGMLAVGLVLAGLVLAVVMPRQCPVNCAAAYRIKEGMTQAEVHAILGGPPGDYRTRPSAHPYSWYRFRFGPPRLIEEWIGDEGTVTVDYHRRTSPGPETVTLARFEAAEPYNPGLVAIATWRLERLKARLLP
jgi:hypothetical protein